MKLLAEQKVGAGVIRILQGDLTLAETEAIVNAANSHLQHGGGVAAAIARRGGPAIQEESDRVDFVPEGEVAVTTGGNLRARHVIHAVGPRGGDPRADEKLTNATRNSLLAAQELGLSSIAFPAISTGIFGFPKERCAQIMTATTRNYLENNAASSLQQVDFVLFDDETTKLFKRQLLGDRVG